MAVRVPDDLGRSFMAKPSKTYAPARPGDTDFAVVRPARFALVRTVQGTVPECLALDVPGGSTGRFFAQVDQFPDTFATGDRVLAFFGFTSPAGPPVGLLMLWVDDDNSVRLPVAGGTRLDLDTWGHRPPRRPA